MASKEQFLAELARGAGSFREAQDRLGLSRNTVTSWFHRDAGFHDRAKALRDGTPPAPENVSAPGVPDFFRWRELHGAYYRRDGSVARAQNNWYQLQAIRAIEEHSRLVMILPPGHIKTTLFSIEYPTWNIMRNRNFRSLIVQKSQPEAQKVLSSVKTRLADHDYYRLLDERLQEQGDAELVDPIEAYAPKVGFRPNDKDGAVWTQTQLKVAGAELSGEKEVTMEAKGAGSAIMGIRSDLIILDDIQDPRFKEGEAVDKLYDWLNEVILSRLYDDQKLIILGNRLGPEDIYSRIMEGKPNWDVVKFPAILSEERKEVLCPELWSFEGLQRKRDDVGEEVWASMWMQEEVQPAGAAFSKDAMQAAHDQDLVLRHPPDGFEVVIGVDPAVAASGYCAICCWGVNPTTGQRILVDMVNQKDMRTWTNVAKVVLEKAVQYRARTVVVEWNATQQALFFELERDCVARGIRLKRYQTVTATGASAEIADFSISDVGALYDQDLVILPYGDPYSRIIVDPYVRQCLAWRAGRKKLTRDMVMATTFAESEAREIVRRGSRRPAKERDRVPKWVRRKSRDKPELKTWVGDPISGGPLDIRIT